MGLSHTAALAAVRALKKRGLLALDGRNDEEAENVIRNSETGDRTMRSTRDTRRSPRMGDAEMREREREEDCRDALRRAADAETLDPEEIEDVLESIARNYPEILAKVHHEMAGDMSSPARGPKGWARDRAERRRAEDTLRAKDAMRARKFGRTGRDDPPPFEGMPRTGGGMDPIRDERGEGYRTDRSWEENGHGVPAEDRRRGRAFDLAMDAGDTQDAFANWLPGATSIGKI